MHASDYEKLKKLKAFYGSNQVLFCKIPFNVVCAWDYLL